MLPAAAASSSRTVAALVAAQVAAGPARLAVVDAERALTYAALDARAARLANHLRQHGAARGRVVAVVLPQSAELVVAALAVLRADATCAPVDPATLPRIGAMLADARPCAIVTRAGLATRLPRGPWRVVALDADAAEIDREPTASPAPQAGSSDLASLVYATASPMRPRRVEVTHAELLDIVRWHHGALRVAPADRALLMSSGGFASARKIWPYLAAGASLHLPDDVTCMDPEALRDWVVAQDITIAVVATSMAERLLALPWPTAKRLRALLSGAAVRPAALAGASFVGGWEPLAEHVEVIRAPHPEPILRRGAIRVSGADTSRSAA